jgi:hypothetical protein
MPRNIDDWRLDIKTWQWERVTDRRWQQWEVRRKDGARIHLYDIGQALWHRDAGGEWREEFAPLMDKLEEELGVRPDLDLATRLFKPEIKHETVPEVEDEYSIHQIKIDGVVVRYAEDFRGFQITFEGAFPQATIDAVLVDLQRKLGLLENCPCEARRL